MKAQYPEIVFVPRRIRARSGTAFTVEGTLTLRGIAKPVTVRVVLKTAPHERLSFGGKAVVKMRRITGLKPPRAALGTLGTKNEMDVIFQLIAVPAN